MESGKLLLGMLDGMVSALLLEEILIRYRREVAVKQVWVNGNDPSKYSKEELMSMSKGFRAE